MKKLLLVIGLVLVLSASALAASVPATFSGTIWGQLKSVNGSALSGASGDVPKLGISVNESTDTYAVSADFTSLFAGAPVLDKYRVDMKDEAFTLTVWGKNYENGKATPFGFVTSGKKATNLNAKARLQISALTVDVDDNSEVKAFAQTAVGGITVGGAAQTQVAVADPTVKVDGYMSGTAAGVSYTAEVASDFAFASDNLAYAAKGSMALSDQLSANAQIISQQANVGNDVTYSVGGKYAAGAYTAEGSYANSKDAAGAFKKTVTSIKGGYTNGSYTMAGSYGVTDDTTANNLSEVSVSGSAPLVAGSTISASYAVASDKDGNASKKNKIADGTEITLAGVSASQLSVSASLKVNDKLVVAPSYLQVATPVESYNVMGASATYKLGNATLSSEYFVGTNDYAAMVVEQSSRFSVKLGVAF